MFFFVNPFLCKFCTGLPSLGASPPLFFRLHLGHEHPVPQPRTSTKNASHGQTTKTPMPDSRGYQTDCDLIAGDNLGSSRKSSWCGQAIPESMNHWWHAWKMLTLWDGHPNLTDYSGDNALLSAKQKPGYTKSLQSTVARTMALPEVAHENVCVSIFKPKVGVSASAEKPSGSNHTFGTDNDSLEERRAVCR